MPTLKAQRPLVKVFKARTPFPADLCLIQCQMDLLPPPLKSLRKSLFQLYLLMDLEYQAKITLEFACSLHHVGTWSQLLIFKMELQQQLEIMLTKMFHLSMSIMASTQRKMDLFQKKHTNNSNQDLIKELNKCMPQEDKLSAQALLKKCLTLPCAILIKTKCSCVVIHLVDGLQCLQLLETKTYSKPL